MIVDIERKVMIAKMVREALALDKIIADRRLNRAEWDHIFFDESDRHAVSQAWLIYERIAS